MNTSDRSPLFSIITICLNHVSGLKATHQSLSQQRYQNFEWIVIDGGSGPDTRNFLQTTRALWVSEKDNGLYDAMNKGIEKSSGDYLLFLNAGDLLANATTLATIAQELEQTIQPPGFIYGDAIEDGHVKKARPAATLTQGLFTHHQAMLYKRDHIGALRYDLRYKIAADYAFTAQFLAQDCNTLHIPQPLCIFETGGVSQKYAKAGRMEQWQIRKDLNMTTRVHNTLIFIKHWLSWGLRSTCPKLYWFLRERA